MRAGCMPSLSAVTTSWYSGSPIAPGSLVRSRTAISRPWREGLRGTLPRRTGDTAGPSARRLSRLGVEMARRFLDRARAGAHHDDDALGIGGADVIEQVIGAADDLGELVHDVLTMAGQAT